MNINYDLHIHSGLSPCADNDMSPINILAMASVKNLQMIAVSDHNAIDNVKIAMELGDLLHITVVPAMELQTAEDIHILCLFKTYKDLQAFYSCINFTKLDNNEQIYGEQIIYDEDGKDVLHRKELLLVASDVPSYKVKKLAEKFYGVAIPAHIDREENGMLNILGDIDSEFKVVELNDKNSNVDVKNRLVLVNSDAHTLVDIGKNNSTIKLQKNSTECLIEYLKNYD